MMTGIAVRVEGIGKRYRIGLASSRNDSLRETIAEAFRAPLRNLRDLRMLSRFEGDGADVVWALRDVSFDVRQGEVLGVIGRNGAGKSTLLKVLSRITEPTTGRAEVHGRVGALLEVGTGFHPDLTGRQNVYLNGAILGMDRAYIRRRFDEIVSFAGVERYIDTPVKRYSSGMYLRLAFAVAAHLEPEVLIVDEVLAVGDAEFQKKCMGKMGDVAREGRTVLFVSHNLGVVRTLCDSVLLMKEGRVASRGDPDAVIETYLAEQSQSTTGERVWLVQAEAPGDDDIRVTAVRILNNLGVPATEFGDADDFFIEIRYDVFHELRDAKIGFQILSPEGVLVLESFQGENLSAYDANDQAGVHAPGSYRGVCRVPGSLLNSGMYYVKLWGYIHNVKWLFQQEVLLPFSVLATSDGAFRRGLIGTPLEWDSLTPTRVDPFSARGGGRTAGP